MPAAAGDEDPARVVDPDLLDRGVVEERLQRPEAGDPGDQLADHRVDVGDRRDRAGQAALVVVADHALGDPAYDGGVALRVDALAAHRARAPAGRACSTSVAVRVLTRDRHRCPRPEWVLRDNLPTRGRLTHRRKQSLWTSPALEGLLP